MCVCGVCVPVGAHKPRTQSPVLFLKKPPPLFSKGVSNWTRASSLGQMG